MYAIKPSIFIEIHRPGAEGYAIMYDMSISGWISQ